ncbi:MAG: type II secretion system protein N [Mariprofundus sp.]|nr:type II secretion system protein N [Mariprofundus sp.]
MTLSRSSHAPASWWQLFAVFIIALLLFLGLRWQPEIWLGTQINKLAKQQGITLSYDRLQLHAFTMHIKNISITNISIQNTQQPNPIIIDSITLSPAWSALLSGNPAVQIHTQWHGQSAAAVLSQQGEHILLQDISADIEATSLQPILNQHLPLAVNIFGQLHLSGSLELQTNAHPLQGNIELSWRAAALDLSSHRIDLGDYKLAIQNNQPNIPWQWVIGGGSALILSGKGQIDASAQNPQTWLMTGEIQIKAAKKATMLSSILGSKSKKFSLSGNISQPQLRPL